MATKRTAVKKKDPPSKAKHSGKVAKVMHEFKEGDLKTRGSRTVTNPKQAIAIALSEARASGENVPPPPGKRAATKKSAPRKTAAKKRG